MDLSELMTYPGSRKSRMTTSFQAQKRDHNTLPFQDYVLNFLFLVIHKSPLHGLLFWLWFIVMTLHLVPGNNVILKTVTEASCWSNMSWHTSDKHACGHSSIPAWAFVGANFAIFQHCHHYFQNTEASIQICTQFSGCNLPIHMDELIKTLHGKV